MSQNIVVNLSYGNLIRLIILIILLILCKVCSREIVNNLKLLAYKIVKFKLYNVSFKRNLDVYIYIKFKNKNISRNEL